MRSDNIELKEIIASLQKELSLLKHESNAYQIQVVETLAEKYIQLDKHIRNHIEQKYKNRVVEIKVSTNTNRLITTLLLAILMVNIATISSELSRKKRRDRFSQICDHFGVHESDIMLLLYFLRGYIV